MRGQRVVWEMPDGTIAIGKSFLDDVEAFAAKVEASNAAEGVVMTRLNDLADDYAPPRRWLNCLRRTSGKGVGVDMPAARLQRMTEIREERDAALKAADGPTAREIERETPAAQTWKDYKEALRNLPQNTDLSGAATPEDLEAFIPAWPMEPTT